MTTHSRATNSNQAEACPRLTLKSLISALPASVERRKRDFGACLILLPVP
jgi:hypothetical protein